MEYKKPETQLRNLLIDIVESHIERFGFDHEITVSDIDEDKELNLAILVMKIEDNSASFFSDSYKDVEHLFLKLLIADGEVIEDCRMALSDLIRKYFTSYINALLENAYSEISTQMKEDRGLIFHTDEQTGEGYWL